MNAHIDVAHAFGVGSMSVWIDKHIAEINGSTGFDRPNKIGGFNRLKAQGTGPPSTGVLPVVPHGNAQIVGAFMVHFISTLGQF